MEPEDLPKPLTDDDINASKAKLASLDGKKINEICDGYTRQIKLLINTAKKTLNKKDDEDEIVELERLARLVALLPSDEIFLRSKDKIWHTRKQILDKNVEWFMNRDYSKNIKKDQKQTMIETIIKVVRRKFVALSEDEKDQYWMKAIELLRLVAEFKKLTGEK